MSIADIFKDFGYPVAMTIILLLAIVYLHKEHKAEMSALRQEFKADMQKTQDENRETILQITETHSKEMREITKSVNRLSDSVESLNQTIRAE